MAETLESEAYVLHVRSYRETSLLVEIMSLKHGREVLVARGGRSRRTGNKACLQPFSLLQVAWRARGDLGTLTMADEIESHRLSANNMGIGLYLNELLMRLLPRHQEAHDIFDAYSASLHSLAAALPVEPVLRSFELRLLSGLGYAPMLDREADTGVVVVPERTYRFLPDHGPVPTDITGPDTVSGASLLAMADENWSADETLADAKRLLRIALGAQLGSHVLRTRALLGGLARYRRMSANESPSDHPLDGPVTNPK